MVRGLHQHMCRFLQQRTNLDASFGSCASCGNFLCPFDSFVQIVAVEDVVAGELLFRFCKWTIEDDRLAVLWADCGRRCCWPEWLSSLEDAFLGSLSHYASVSFGDLLHRFWIGGSLLPRVDEQHVTH